LSGWTLGLCLMILLAVFYYYIFVFRLDIRHLSPDNVKDDHTELIKPIGVENDISVIAFSSLRGQRLTPKRRVKTSGRRQNV